MMENDNDSQHALKKKTYSFNIKIFYYNMHIAYRIFKAWQNKKAKRQTVDLTFKLKTNASINKYQQEGWNCFECKSKVCNMSI